MVTFPNDNDLKSKLVGEKVLILTKDFYSIGRLNQRQKYLGLIFTTKVSIKINIFTSPKAEINIGSIRGSFRLAKGPGP